MRGRDAAEAVPAARGYAAQDMELQRTLPPEPASAAAARRLAADALRAWRHDDLVEVTELLVSELVTNAVLHAGSDIDLRLLSSGAGVRVEVADRSDVLPARRSYGRQATTGRGLGLVDMLASSWGAESRSRGKVVWFHVGDAGLEPLSEEDILAAFADLDDPLPDDVAEPEPAGSRERAASGPAPDIGLRLLDLPIALYRAMEQHNDALLRESMLRGFSQADPPQDLPHRSGEGIGASASRLPLKTPAVEAALQDALEAGAASVDLRLTAPAAAREICSELLTALDEADDDASQGGLLVPPALPEIRACRQWCLGEVIAQIDGNAPTPWSPPAEPAGNVPLLAQIDPGVILDNLNDAVIVGDDGNRIRYLNPAAERLLGWSRDELEGQRITVIVPPHLREAHVVGYSRYLVTDVPRLIGRPVRVPARHRNGAELQVELLLSSFRVADGKRAFIASLRDLTERAPRDRAVTTDNALAATSDVAALFGPSGPGGDLQATAPVVLETVAHHLGCQVALLWRPDAAGEELEWAAAWDDGSPGGAGFSTASRHRRFGAGVGIPGRVWESGEPVWIPDVVGDANFARASLALENGLRSAVAFPITTGAGVWGVAEMFSSEVLEENADVLAIVTAMGRQLGAHADDAR